VIRINLLTAERTRAKAAPAGIPLAQRVTIGAALILLLTAIGIGWWYASLKQTSATLDQQIAAAEAETTKLRPVLAQVQSFEARKAQLQQRVTLIEQLRKGQSAPVRVLDQISRSLPDGLWLTDLVQSGSDFTINGYATSMTALSDFVAALEKTTWFRKPVEIIDSQVTTDAKAGDLVRFSVKATYFDPDAPLPAAPAGKK
jgi:type IV pilus assembly protein PilN